MAVIFVTRIDNNESKQEGLCIQCARELGIKPVDDIISKMGLSDEEIERMNSEMQDFLENNDGSAPDLFGEQGDGTPGGVPAPGGAPAFNLAGFLRGEMTPQEKQSKKKQGKKDPRAEEPKEKPHKYLDAYCTDLTARAREGKLDRIVGRDRDLARVIQILCRRQKNNPCLIGEPGVGKTAIAEALAQRIVDGNVPYRLKNSAVELLDLTALVAGTQFRGQFESRVLGLLSEVRANGNIILVIDEVHKIVGTGDAEGSMNAANILKPALSRGEIQVVGATTLTEYRKYIEKDTALERRFQPVMVNEPSVEESVEILKGIRHYYESYHGIRIPESVLRSAVTLSERYITDRYLPDKAIDLIDEAASHLSLSSPDVNERMEVWDARKALDVQMKQLESAMNNPENPPSEDQYKQLADLKSEDARMENRLAELNESCEKIEMTVSDLADVIEIWTGVPASSIREDEFVRLESLEERLSKRIIGQAEAVSAVSRAIRRNRTGIAYKRKPVSFIFAGPTGVGKTELVKVLADDLFSSPETLIRLDMSEFMDKFSVSRIIGSPPGYVGYDDAGQLTEKIRRHPYSVVLFDEIEKAHPDVMNILLQILDDGRITDAQGKTVSFENTVIVMTTNAGSQTGSGAIGFTESPDLKNAEKTQKALSEFLRPEFLNRVDEIITFHQLTPENFRQIAELMLGDLSKVLSDKGISFRFTQEAARHIAEESYSLKYGARNMRRYIQTHVEDQISSEIIERRGEIREIRLDSDGSGLQIVCA
ncbi:MAG: ATP-dependent Clp protease ATP-binding subunit [Clostridia bacterium]|nr:ATP-dependent Clp protease ATP-binding subunit [Clostridia bacterium]